MAAVTDIIIPIELATIQGTEAWFEAKLGKVSASRIKHVMAKTTKGGWGADRDNYMAELVVERLTGKRSETFVNAAMEWGTMQEPHARAAYSFMLDVDVVEVGFIDHPRIPMSGASPDGLVGKRGMIEIKCPSTKTHIATLRRGTAPTDYVDQMQWQMACTDREWVHFVSFDPRLPEPLNLFIKRVERNEARIMVLEKAVIDFLEELNQVVESLLDMSTSPLMKQLRDSVD